MVNNPILNKVKTKSGVNVELIDETEVSTASYRGISLKTLLLLAITTIIAISIAVLVNKPEYSSLLYSLIAVSGVLSFVCTITTIFSARYIKVWGMFYAASQGVLLGATTSILEMNYPGIGFMAIFSTLIVFLAVLIAYRTNIIKVNFKFIKVLVAMGLASVMLFMFTFIFSIIPGFGKFITGNLFIIVPMQLFFLIYGCMALSLNFEMAKSLVKYELPKNLEWMVAYGIFLSIIYIYIQILRFLIIILSRVSKD